MGTGKGGCGDRCGAMLAVAATLALSAPTLAQAQTAGRGGAQNQGADDRDIGEIIVTATRQEQKLSHVPLSIVAQNQAALDQRGVRSVSDIARLTPSITFGQTSQFYGTGQSAIAIRGVQSTSGIPTTGIYIDDMPIQTRTGASPSLGNAYPQIFDLDRIEVLRGPQGTLFGTGAMGGALRFITPAPALSGYSLYGRSEIATTEHGAPSYEAGVAGGAAIVEDRLGFRASVWYRRDGGYMDRLDRVTKAVAAPDVDGQHSVTARLALAWKPTDALKLTPSLYFQNTDIADNSRYELATSDGANAQFRTSLSKLPESHHDQFFAPALKGELELGRVTIVSNTSWFIRDTRTQSDDTTLSFALFADYSGPLPAGFEDYYSATYSRTAQRMFVQEIRAQNNDPTSRFNWVAGLYYSRATTRDSFDGSDPRLLDIVNYGQEQAGQPPFASVEDAFGVGLIDGRDSVRQRITHRDRQIALFAQADYELLPRVKLTAGLRYSRANYDFESNIAGPLYATTGTVSRLSSKSAPLTPKFGLSFQMDRDNLFYTNVAKGVRGSGVAEAVGSNCAADGAAIGFDPLKSRSVQPDSLWSYEAGSKNRLLGGRLILDASVYHVDWKGVQTTLTLPVCQLNTTLNLGRARIDGLDLAVTLQPFAGLSLGAAASYVDARYTTNLTGPGDTIIRRSGEPLDVAPWSVTLNGEYVHALGRYAAYGRADFTYSSHDRRPVDANSPLVDPALPRAPATSQLNLRTGLRFDAVDVSLFVNNVTNSHPVLGLYHDSLDSLHYRATTFRPRTIGLTATVRR